MKKFLEPTKTTTAESTTDEKTADPQMSKESQKKTEDDCQPRPTIEQTTIRVPTIMRSGIWSRIVLTNAKFDDFLLN